MRIIIITFIFLLHFNSFSQVQEKIDFKKADISIHIATKEKEVKGKVVYEFDVLQEVDTIFLDAKKMNFTSVTLNNKKVKFNIEDDFIIIHKKFKKSVKNKLSVNYSVKPKQTVYFIDVNNNSTIDQIWTQGQGKYTSYWLPSFDDMNEKVEFDLSITFDKEYAVVANGKLKQKKELNEKITWFFDMEKPMSSYLLAFAIGKYTSKQITSLSGVPIDLYYYPNDSSKVEPTYRYSKQIFDFLENEIGVAYPWQNYKQIPVKDFLYAGMENTSATIFSDAYFIDSTAFIDKNYVNVNAHELAHQWFGNLVTEVDGNSHWLHEGFATYYALLAEKEIFGDEYFYWKLFDSAESLIKAFQNNNGEALRDDKASSLTFYEKGAWALVMLKNEIGEEAFNTGIKTYLDKYKYKNVTIRNFLDVMEVASGKSLKDFEAEWITGTKFPIKVVAEYLINKSESLATGFELKNELRKLDDVAVKKQIITSTFKTSKSIYLKKNIILNTPKELLSDEILKSVFASNDVLVRQAIAIAVDEIPENFQTDFKSLLNDESYITVENALYKLWAANPEQRKTYLNTTKDVIGLPNKNIRLLWLALALITEDYNSLKTKEYFDELESYTDPKYNTEIRQAAFQYLQQTFGLTDTSLINLANATEHHSWQFKKFARNLVKELLKDEDYKNRFSALAEQLNKEEMEYIKSQL
ncbi:M1 family metallopeptidase [Cellulophaga sp. HaHaR_3_176]|uniref:M1 family metallopeptidase n=1 Tax=Cellulophaga sp. HaHaR_3_176 TaxID=1942464 RepID=UPI001C1F8825|nr:M1 family metallopeptidase [Cellulophaga sp. HaHaR_3_176]QWX85078.1 M1 family metallopeptidase [Cellulophaga sp. HaHaR_3_176]